MTARVAHPLRRALERAQPVQAHDGTRVVQEAERGPELRLPGYLDRSPDGTGGGLVRAPAREDAGLIVNEGLVVEFHAR